MDMRQAETRAKDWIQGWKRRDAEAVLSHYADDVEFQSPLVVRLLGEPSGTVRGKQGLREYFRKVLAAIPVIEIELVGVYLGLNSLLVHFQANGNKSVEIMELDNEGKVRRAITLGEVAAPSTNAAQ